MFKTKALFGALLCSSVVIAVMTPFAHAAPVSTVTATPDPYWPASTDYSTSIKDSAAGTSLTLSGKINPAGISKSVDLTGMGNYVNKPDGQQPSLLVTLQPDAADVGKPGHMYVAINLPGQNTYFFLYSTSYQGAIGVLAYTFDNGQFTMIEGDLKNLYRSTIQAYGGSTYYLDNPHALPTFTQYGSGPEVGKPVAIDSLPVSRTYAIDLSLAAYYNVIGSPAGPTAPAGNNNVVPFDVVMGYGVITDGINDDMIAKGKFAKVVTVNIDANRPMINQTSASAQAWLSTLSDYYPQGANGVHCQAPLAGINCAWNGSHM